MLGNEKYKFTRAVAARGRLLGCLLLIVLVVGSATVRPQFYAFAGPPQSEAQDAVNAFKKTAADYLASFTTNKREQIVKLDGGWVKQIFEPGESNIDVRRTDSLVSPYLGILRFSLTRHFTTFHKTRQDAENDNNFVQTDTWTHEHTYSYQDSNWVLKIRKSQFDKMVSEGMTDWYDCKESNGCW